MTVAAMVVAASLAAAGIRADWPGDHRLFIVNGHDEHWTKQMRDAFNSARNAGTNLAFFGSNAAYRQVR
jgi:N,N-dimethylformamidase beta subunit-like, C-terminal